MRKAFKFRIYPTKRQESVLTLWLSLCCELYNAALQERRDAYKLAGISISYQDQQNQLPDIKKSRQDLKAVHSQVIQDVLKRLDKAFQAFFRRLKNGHKPGYPRFRSRSRYNSFSYSQSGFSIEGDKLFLSKIGHIKIKQHRPIDGKIKTCSITLSSTGKWSVCFSVEIEARPLPYSAKAIGADAGLETFATLSNGIKIANPRFLREEERELAKAQRQLSAVAKGSKQRKKAKKKVARINERIVNKRNNFAHQESRKLVDEYGIICIEALKILNMTQNHRLAKSIADAAWYRFFSYVIYKAEWADRMTDKVPPAHTSTDCHKCGHRRTDLTLVDRIYHCSNPGCGLVIDRDINAAQNILALGLQRLGLSAIEAPA